jgi:hypothetical protein
LKLQTKITNGNPKEGDFVDKQNGICEGGNLTMNLCCWMCVYIRRGSHTHFHKKSEDKESKSCDQSNDNSLTQLLYLDEYPLVLNIDMTYVF